MYSFPVGHVVRPLSPLAADVAAGLSARPKTLAARHFYDRRGSQLFQRITELEEYYLTPCEREIILRYRSALAERLRGRPLRIVELGAGDGTKTELLLDEFLMHGIDVEYVPIDICPEILAEAARRLRRRFARHTLPVRPLAAEYLDGLARLQHGAGRACLVLFLGSSIGNLHPAEARDFLRGLRRQLRPGDALLAGFDLKKDVALMQRAYDDRAGVTREFNLNLLERLNRELGAAFDRTKFAHHCLYDPAHGRMESWLLSTQRQTVRVAALDRHFHFEAWEGIHVECSYKYDLPQIETLAAGSGFAAQQNYFDVRHYFVDSLWGVGESDGLQEK